MTIAYFILGFINIFAEMVELTYDLGVFTRQHILPVIVMTYVFIEMGWDKVTSMEMNVNVINTPMTTGFAFGR